jgi:hypothetical protein
MRFPPFLIALLVVAFALTDVCFWAATHGGADFGPTLPQLIFLGLIFAQVNLLAAWMAVGNGNLVIQVIVGAIGVVALWAILPGRNRQAFGLLLLEQSLLVFLMLLAARLAGYRLRQSSGALEASPHWSPWQFSLSNILQATTLAAALTAVVVRIAVDQRIAWEATWLAAAFGAPIAPILFAMLSTIHRLQWAAVAVATCFLAAGSLRFFEQSDRVLVVIMCLGQLVAVVLVLLLVRVAGYRLTRQTSAA